MTRRNSSQKQEPERTGSQEDAKWWQTVNLRELRVGSMLLKEMKDVDKACEYPRSCFNLNDKFDSVIVEDEKPETPSKNERKLKN